MADHLAWLRKHKFRRYGSWKPGARKLLRCEKLERGVPGIYAFVVDSIIYYIGKAEKHLRGRVRSYNRSLKENDTRKRRTVHEGIKSSLRSNKTVDVYIFVSKPNDDVAAIEMRWVRKLRPEWNEA